MIEWERRTLAGIDLAVDVVAGVDVTLEEDDGAGSMIQFAPPIELALWYGPGQTLQRWHDGVLESWPDATFEPATTTIGGGEPAHRQRVLLPASEAEGGFPTPSGEVELRVRRRTARAQVAIAFVLGETPVLATFSVEPDQGEEYQTAEERFFAGLVRAS